MSDDRYIDLDKARRSRSAKAKANSDPDWLRAMQRDDRGRPLGNLANAMVALRTAPELQDALAEDQMMGVTMLLRTLPCVVPEEAEVGVEPRPIRDSDVSQLQEWLQCEGLPRISKDIAHQAVDLRAVERGFHPVTRYLKSLKWDGKKRLDRWLPYYLGAEANPYTAGIGAMALTALVARVFEPGCKCDYALILEGPQGARKSTACSILGGEWFSDSLPDVTNGKDVAQHLVGKWLIEISELSAMSKAESNTLKAFISRPVERYRPTYGRKEVIQPRQCCFIGTTDKAAYLRDETGGRRFWPVKVGKIDTDALTHDRDQLFAEAVERFNGGGRWWPDEEFERKHIAPEQECRFEADVWEDSIRSYLNGKTIVLVGEVAREALSIETPRIGRAEQTRITSILERLQWFRRKKDSKGNIPWGPLAQS